jgi:hypothetical protein
VPPRELRTRLVAGRREMRVAAAGLPLATIYSDAAWGWIYSVLHGHSIDHLRILEPWADHLRVRQVQNDPFGLDPQPSASDLVASKARFWADEAAVFDILDNLLDELPAGAWTGADVTPGWTIADHVGHLTAWFDETVDTLDEHARTGRWRELPAEGIDAWNDRQVLRARETPVAIVREAYETGRDRLRRAVAAMPDDVWLDPEGFSWAYEDLHGHARAHLAMIAPFIARIGWPEK